jgi:penicillin-binding protein 1A
MGYTPQILAGAWVGCDDRYIRFTDNYFGQGAHASLPIWAYFMEKVSNDPACNLDQNASFLRPSNLLNDFDVNFISKDTSAIDKSVPLLDNVEEVAAESDYTIPTSQQPQTASKPASKLGAKQAPVKEIPKKQTDKANKEVQKPKAILPPKKK